MKSDLSFCPIPTKFIGPIKIVSAEINDSIKVPLATFEKPLWPSVARGAKISRLCSGIKAVLVKNCMTRSVILEAPDAGYASNIVNQISNYLTEISRIVTDTSKHIVFQDVHAQIVGNLIYLRLDIQAGDASGHNMVTKAADALISYMLEKFSKLKYVSISGNYCTDKKVSAVNGILGRGKYVVAEIIVPHGICKEHLRTTAQKIVELNIKKNLIGGIIAGSICSANAHFANMLLALYLATGQDAANIIEGSQGITHAELKNNDLYFSVTLPNIIVGTVGNGRDLDFAQANLESMNANSAGKLAIIIAATVLCGELSLLAAQTNQGELTKAHLIIERS